ncbi:terminase [Mycobacterium phage Redno2]|uniref:terminase large subunit n=1 Tax=Mycobacterium phage Redno2 TaxID=1340709 RepID=UPI000387AA9A|nr:terminase large subunit [Mycobacterium phage Redno2]AGS82300.1 terminase [Mycobacterium phage Redno2]AWH13814.1 terminase [Mycobacterium phage Halley]QDP43750.1 terminase [Mycobacterium phage Dallas]
MELLAHQKLIHDTIDNSSVSAFAAPRQNGKTYAAVNYALQYPGKVLYFSRGFREARCAFDLAVKMGDRGPGTWSVIQSSKANGRLSVNTSLCGAFGQVDFLPYGRGSARGLIADLVILDDADEVEPEVLGDIYPAVLTTGGKIAAFGLLHKQGLLAHVAGVADGRRVWWGGPCESWDQATIAEANPALGHLFTREQVGRELKILPREVFARDRLGITPPKVEFKRRGDG